jgi:hypothetical protein
MPSAKFTSQQLQNVLNTYTRIQLQILLYIFDRVEDGSTLKISREITNHPEIRKHLTLLYNENLVGSEFVPSSTQYFQSTNSRQYSQLTQLTLDKMYWVTNKGRTILENLNLAVMNSKQLRSVSNRETEKLFTTQYIEKPLENAN